METTMGELELSRGSAVILLFLYAAFLYYQLFVPSNAYHNKPTPVKTTEGYQNIGRTYTEESEFQDVPSLPKVAEDGDDEDEEEEDVLGFRYALVWLGVITVCIYYLSDLLVDSVTGAAASMNISTIFLSAIIIPIIGNAAEHASAITFGYKDRLELSLGIAVGSSTQIALLVLPLLTVVGWVVDRPMSFNFSTYEATTLLLTIITVTFALKDGKSNWLLGLILLGAYGVIALGFWAHKDEGLDST
jgi:Ca2+:H+ antiporter